jgi:hypothetical protein
VAELAPDVEERPVLVGAKQWSLPIRAVSYPASRQSRKACASPAGIGVSLRRAPWACGQRPVQSDTRAGTHSGCGVMATSKRVPAAARRASAGVSQKALP